MGRSFAADEEEAAPFADVTRLSWGRQRAAGRTEWYN